MKIELEVPGYSNGLHMNWEDGYVISAKIDNETIIITANHAGLVSLARLLLTLADERAPAGSHWHLDDSNSLEEGSCELVIDKL
jgi:hypothetical protein